MLRRLSRLLNAPRNGLALIPALAAIALFAAPSASAATPLTGEALNGTATTTSGQGYGNCLNRGTVGASANFNASGPATGPYAGKFVEVNGSAGMSGYRNPPWRLTLGIPFTITSGTTTITGRITNPYPWMGGIGFICNSTSVVGFTAGANWATYTAMITVPGRAPQTINGKVQVIGNFSTQPGAQTSITAKFTSTSSSGQITGTVTDSSTHAAISGICVKAYDSSGGLLASAQTNAGGVYTLSALATGSDRVGFASGCGAGNYLTQYYNAKASLASADPVSVTDGATTSGINAAMLPGGQITGVVTDRATGAPITGICVDAYDSSGAVAASAQTSTSGDYTLSALGTGSYRVGFVDCNASVYVTQYYNVKTSLASADPVAVTAGATRSGINAAMVAEGQITGKVTDSSTAVPLSGICVDLYSGNGNVVSSVSTDGTGLYTTPHMAAGTYRVGFFNCGGSTYAAQYYNEKPSLASANSVTIADGTVTSGINAAMVRSGQITGTVTDSVTHAPVAGICADVLDSSGNNISLASTNGSGVYTITGLQTGSYRVEFFSQCGTMNYVTQYYNGKASLANADPVAVTVAKTTSGINAAIVKGGEITGTVTDSSTGAPISGICVDAFDSNGNDVAAGYTDGTGAYTIYGAPPGGARVEFYSQASSYSNPSCGGTNYITQYYKAKASLATANPITVASAATTTGINAAMTAG
jgi:5-hydroxyisourate hydrolase-like protein (transthyretin family)